MYLVAVEICYIPSNEVRREPVVAESIFWVMDVVTSTGLPMRFGSAGMSRAPLPDGATILSCGCPCVCSDAISSCLSILSSFCCFRASQRGELSSRGPGGKRYAQCGRYACRCRDISVSVVRFGMRWD